VVALLRMISRGGELDEARQAGKRERASYFTVQQEAASGTKRYQSKLRCEFRFIIYG
jgi:hypothetical protein